MNVMTHLVLSTFPGMGLLDMAFEEAGFCVVRGPDVLWGGNIKTFHPPVGRFDGVIGGPPCQAFSRLRHIVEANGYKTAENLIPEFERVIREALPAWFLMENVPGAPEPITPGYGIQTITLNNRWCGGEQNRMRRISVGLRGRPAPNLWRFLELEALEPAAWAPAVCASGGNRETPRVAIGGSGKRKKVRANDMGYVSKRPLAEALRLQGLPADFLDKAPFTVAGKQRVIGNGVPLPLGRVRARALVSLLADLEQQRDAA